MWSWMSWRIYLGSIEGGWEEKEQNRMRMSKGRRKRMDDKN